MHQQQSWIKEINGKNKNVLIVWSTFFFTNKSIAKVVFNKFLVVNHKRRKYELCIQIIIYSTLHLIWSQSKKKYKRNEGAIKEMLYFIILMITMCKVKSMPVLPTSIVTRLFYGLSLLLTLPTGKKRFLQIIMKINGWFGSWNGIQLSMAIYYTMFWS